MIDYNFIRLRSTGFNHIDKHSLLAHTLTARSASWKLPKLPPTVPLITSALSVPFRLLAHVFSISSLSSSVICRKSAGMRFLLKLAKLRSTCAEVWKRYERCLPRKNRKHVENFLLTTDTVVYAVSVAFTSFIKKIQYF